MLIRLILTIFALCMLAGCKTKPFYILDSQDKINSYIKTKQSITHFTVQGKMSITTNIANTRVNNTFNFAWQQMGDNLIFKITSPLHSTIGIIHANAVRAHLTTNDGQIIEADSVEEILIKFFGWSIPLHALKNWILGVPIQILPYAIDSYTYQGLPESLKQHDWSIHYEQYFFLKEAHEPIPKIITLDNQALGTNIKIIIKHIKLIQVT